MNDTVADSLVTELVQVKEQLSFARSRIEELEGVLNFNTSSMAEKIFTDMQQEKGHHPSSIINFINNDHWIYQICCAVMLELDMARRQALSGKPIKEAK